MATKRRTTFDEKRDQAVANDAGVAQELMCSAYGCPNRWTIDSPDKGIHRCCTAHAWAPRHDWPAITQAQQWDEAERARLHQEIKHPAVPLTKSEKVAILQKLASLAQVRAPAEQAERIE